MKNYRLDAYLHDKGYVTSRERSKQLILGKFVYVDDKLITKPSYPCLLYTSKGVSTARTGVAEGITNLFSKNNYAKGIKVEINEDTVVLDIFINVEYGYRINQVAKEVQLAIKKEIETMTDLQVAAVNVHVLNIVQDKEKDKDKDKEKEPVDIALE